MVSLVISNTSGISFINPLSNQPIIIGGGGNWIRNSLIGCPTSFTVCAKISGSRYVYGMGVTYQNGSYVSESTTNILIERDGGNMLLSANAGIVGGYFTPTIS